MSTLLTYSDFSSIATSGGITPDGATSDVSVLFDGNHSFRWADSIHNDARGQAWLRLDLPTPKLIDYIDFWVFESLTSASGWDYGDSSVRIIDVYADAAGQLGEISHFLYANRYVGRTVVPRPDLRGGTSVARMWIGVYTATLLISLVANNGNANIISISELEIGATNFVTEGASIASTSTVIRTEITSQALISVSDGSELTSTAYILDPTTMSSITSTALVGEFGNYITSTAAVSVPEYATLSSTACISRTGEASQWGFSTKATRLGMRTSTTAISSYWNVKLPFHNNPNLNVLVDVDGVSTSTETIVNDLITSPIDPRYVLDLSTSNPPLGYSQYDWAYDWVVTTKRSCVYKFEARSADSLDTLAVMPFVRVSQGQIIPKEYLKKYHQWRAHVWASGSGDFKLHQFTVKAYVNYPSSTMYRSLAPKPFYTTSPITTSEDTPIPGGGGPAQFAAMMHVPGVAEAVAAIKSES